MISHPSNPVSVDLVYKPACDSIIFDLDGTLWDASNTTAIGWSRVAKQFEMNSTISADSIRNISGLPTNQCIETLFGAEALSQSTFVEELSRAEREEILRAGGTLYHGVAEGLRELKENFKILLVSNCPDWYLEAFFQLSGLRHYFDDAVCFGNNQLPKKENIRQIARRNGCNKPVYVGDTHWDQHAAYYAGTKFIFAEYGFGSVNTKRCPAINSFSELSQIFNSKTPAPKIEVRRLGVQEFSQAKEFYASVEYVQPLDPSSRYYAGFHGDKVIGIVRLAFEENVWVLRGMQVNPKYQFLGIGTQLIRLLESDLNGEECYCLPYGWLEKFYGQIGFETVLDQKGAPLFLRERLTANLKSYPELILMIRKGQHSE